MCFVGNCVNVDCDYVILVLLNRYAEIMKLKMPVKHVSQMRLISSLDDDDDDRALYFKDHTAPFQCDKVRCALFDYTTRSLMALLCAVLLV